MTYRDKHKIINKIITGEGSNLKKEKQILDKISNSIKSAGYDPDTQLYGYFLTGNDSYITRQDNARNIIKSVDKNELESFLNAMKAKQS